MTHLQSDVKSRLGPSRAEDPLWSQRLQSPSLVGCQDVKGFVVSRELREGGLQQVHKVRLLQTPRTLELQHRTFLET